MAREIGQYDSDLQMFVDKPRVSDMNHLRFLRRLMEAGKFGRFPVSVPKGENVFRMTNAEIRKYAMIEADAELKYAPPALPETPTDRIAKTGDY